jgi:hypothetical protein
MVAAAFANPTSGPLAESSAADRAPSRLLPTARNPETVGGDYNIVPFCFMHIAALSFLK